MRKIIFIFFLLLFNILLIYSKVNSKSDINLKIKKDELVIVIINNINSKALLLLKNDVSIAYILDYDNDKNLKKELHKFTNNLDYVYMNDNYNINIKNKKIIEPKIISKIALEKNKITYNNFRFCIDKELSCDVTYLNKEEEIVGDNLKSVVYNNNLNPKISNDWLDTYSIGNNNYIIIFVNNYYEINNLER